MTENGCSARPEGSKGGIGRKPRSWSRSCSSAGANSAGDRPFMNRTLAGALMANSFVSMETMDAMNEIEADALVFFGATGDLAHKKIFPALQALAQRGKLEMPVIGVANAGWTLDQLKARARDSVERYGGLHAGAFAQLTRLMDYVDGDYGDARTFQ